VGEAGDSVGEAKGELDAPIPIDVDVEMPSASRSPLGCDGRRRCVPSILGALSVTYAPMKGLGCVHFVLMGIKMSGQSGVDTKKVGSTSTASILGIAAG
jgi:hypothetical protein